MTFSEEPRDVAPSRRASASARCWRRFFCADNAIGGLPMALGGLKEKKVRALDFDGNPLNDEGEEDDRQERQPGEGAADVRAQEQTSAAAASRGGKGGKGKKGKGKKKAVAESDESDEARRRAGERAPRPPPHAPDADGASRGGLRPRPADAPRARRAHSDSRTRKARERGGAHATKERVKAERKLAERRSAGGEGGRREARGGGNRGGASSAHAAVDAAALGGAESDVDSDDGSVAGAETPTRAAAAGGAGAYTRGAGATRGGGESRGGARGAGCRRARTPRKPRSGPEGGEGRRGGGSPKAAAEGRPSRGRRVMTWLRREGRDPAQARRDTCVPGKKPGEPPTILCVIPAMVVGRRARPADLAATIREPTSCRSRPRASPSRSGKGVPGMAHPPPSSATTSRRRSLCA